MYLQYCTCTYLVLYLIIFNAHTLKTFMLIKFGFNRILSLIMLVELIIAHSIQNFRMNSDVTTSSDERRLSVSHGPH